MTCEPRKAAPDACAICGGRAIDCVPETARDEYKFFRCEGCCFVFLHPMSSLEALSKLYEDNTYGIEETRYEKSSSRLRRSIVRSIKLLPCIFRKNVLDVGCGGGFMVEAMRLCGAEASGIDVNPMAIAYAKKRFKRNQFFCEHFDVFADRKLNYDFIFCSELMEHIGDLRYMMAFFTKSMKVGGYIYITTPDYGHPKTPKILKEWDVYVPPYHVQFFNFENARILFNRYGFEMVRKIPRRKPGLHFITRKQSDLPAGEAPGLQWSL